MGKENLFELMEAYRRDKGIVSDVEFCRRLDNVTGYTISPQTLTKYKQIHRKVPPEFMAAVCLTLDLKVSQMTALLDAYFTDTRTQYTKDMNDAFDRFD